MTLRLLMCKDVQHLCIPPVHHYFFFGSESVFDLRCLTSTHTHTNTHTHSAGGTPECDELHAALHGAGVGATRGQWYLFLWYLILWVLILNA